MAKQKKSKTQGNNTIALNKKAKHDYQLEERFEAGLVLEGWEVKSLRAGRVQISDTYVILRNGELWLIGWKHTPLDFNWTKCLSIGIDGAPVNEETKYILIYSNIYICTALFYEQTLNKFI